MQQQQSRVDLALSEIQLIKQSMSTKKKYSPMKEALNAFQNLLQESKKSGTQDIPRQEIQKLLIPAQNQLKSAKFHIALICFLLKLINLKVLNDIQTSEDVLGYFLKIKDIQKDQLQLKLIQSFMSLIHPEFINFGNYAFVEKCLTLVLWMKCSKNPIINTSAETSLYKVIELLSASSQLIIANRGSSFDNMEIQVELGEDCATEPHSQLETATKPDKSKQVQNLVNILNDFVSIADYQRPAWFPASIPLDREFGLVSINSFLTNMGKFFLEDKQVVDLLCGGLLTVLKKLVATPQNMIKPSILIESFKCFIILVDMAPTRFMEIWTLLLNNIKSSDQTYQKYLSYQCLIYFIQTQLFLETLLQLKFNEKNFFLDVITLVSGLCKDTNEPSESEQKKWSEFTNPTINLQGDLELHPADNGFVCRMLSEFQSRFANSICVYADQQKIQLGTASKCDNETFIQLMEHTWRLNLRGIKYLVMKDLDELTLQNALSAFQAYVNITGSIQMKQAQSAFIKTICEFCKPAQSQEFSKRHIQINKMVLNIANCLGNLLECSSWICIFRTFEECENHYLRNRLAKNASQEEQIKTLDISILFQSLDQLFTQSGNYENEHLISVMDAINQLTIEHLEVNEESPNRKKPGGEVKRFFSLSKLVELIKFNLHRLDLFWELIMAHFISVVSSRNQLLVQCASDTLSQIVFYGFEYLTQFHKRSNQQGFIKEKWSKQEAIYQFTLFQPWMDMCNLRQSDIKESLLQNTLRMLQNNGHEIQQRGWDAIMLILFDISSEQTSQFVKQGLACAEYIINQFLSNINPQQLTKLFDIIDNFKRFSNEPNINFQICNMLWNLGDFITKNHSSQSQFEVFLPKIFYKLFLISQDSVPEIRHSSIHIFTNLLLHLNTENQHVEWKRILEQIFVELIHKVVHTYGEKLAANEEDASLWEETVKSALQAFIKLAKKYFMLVDDQSQEKDQDIQVIIQHVLPDMITTLKQNKGALTLEISKDLRELFQYKPTICLQNFGPVLDQISQIFASPPSDMKYLKSLILHISPELLELVSDIIRSCSELHITKVIRIFYQILEFPILAHLKFDLIQNKVFFEDGLAPKNVMLAIQQSLQKGSTQLINCLIQNLKSLLQEAPNDKYKHILVKRHLGQLNQILGNNLQMFFDFTDLYEEIIQIMRLNEADLHYSESLNEEKSVFYLMADFYLDCAQKVLAQQKSDPLAVLKTLQNVLPNKVQFKKILTSLMNTYKHFFDENIAIQDNYIEVITKVYKSNPDFCENELFISFVKSLHELSQIKSNSALNPIKQLCSLNLSPKLMLPYILDMSTVILEREESKTIIVELLIHLQQLVIPENSFLNFVTLDGEEKQLQQHSPAQKPIGHLFYLMPQLAMCVTHKDEEVREQTKKVILLMSQAII